MKEQSWIGPSWHVSPFNRLTTEKTSGIAIPETVTVVDCTLREGEQAPGVVMSVDEKIRLAQEMDSAGFPELELSMPAVSEEDESAVRKICSLHLNAKMIVLCRATRADIDLALDCGAYGASISLPVGYLQLQHKVRRSITEVIDTVVELSRYAHDQGLYVTLSPYDTTRVVLDDLIEYVRQVSQHGHADRIRVVDTVGCAVPSTIAYLVQTITEVGSIPVEVHCHDDFGLAVANTVAGVLAGATAVSTTINGMGERAGNAASEEVVMVLETLYGIRTNVDKTKLFGLSRLVAAATGVPVQPNKAIVGSNAFAQEAGLVVGGFAKEPFTALPFLPELVGQTSRVVLGKKSGKESIKLKVRELDLPVLDDAELIKVLNSLKLTAQQRKGAVPDDDFVAIVRQIKSHGSVNA